MARFSDEEVRRYSRQILLREVGGTGQERLRAARVRLQGKGLVADVAAAYLERAGVGALVREESGAGSAGTTLVHTGAGSLLVACPEVDSATAFAAGSALALEVLKLLLGLVPAPAGPGPLPVDLSAIFGPGDRS